MLPEMDLDFNYWYIFVNQSLHGLLFLFGLTPHPCNHFVCIHFLFLYTEEDKHWKWFFHQPVISRTICKCERHSSIRAGETGSSLPVLCHGTISNCAEKDSSRFVVVAYKLPNVLLMALFVYVIGKINVTVV